jgi:hypothetical protein
MKAALTKLAIVAAMAARGLAGAVPEFPYDRNTASNCNWWQDNVGTEDTDCWMIPAIWEITPEDFIKWVSRPRNQLNSSTRATVANGDMPRTPPFRTTRASLTI